MYSVESSSCVPAVSFSTVTFFIRAETNPDFIESES